MRAPRPHPFLACEHSGPSRDSHAVLWGCATDGGVSFRPGASEGPDGIRRFSDSIESWSPRAGADLDDLTLLDAGDYVRPPKTVERATARLLDDIWDGGRRPLLVTLGGDHSITPPAVRAVASRSERLSVIGFDAHLDLREDYPGDHACTYRRIADVGVPCHVFGPRSGARSEWEDVPEVLRHCSPSLDMPASVRRQLARGDVYVTLDIDVLDPSAAPGTGNPEPGGPSFAELLQALEALEGLNVVAVDVVEVSPPLDPSGITQAAAAVLVREMILRFAPR